MNDPGAEESDEAWVSGVAGVVRNLEGGKRLAKPLRLGLVVRSSPYWDLYRNTPDQFLV